MAKITIVSVFAAFLIAAAIFLAAMTPLDRQSRSVRAAVIGACYLDWPISKLTERVDSTWQGLALFSESQGCRGISPDMPRILALQGLWSAVVYAPVFVAFGAVARRIRRRRSVS